MSHSEITKTPSPPKLRLTSRLQSSINRPQTDITNHKPRCNVFIRSAATSENSSTSTVNIQYLDDIALRLKRLEHSGLMQRLKSKSNDSRSYNISGESSTSNSQALVNNQNGQPSVSVPHRPLVKSTPKRSPIESVGSVAMVTDKIPKIPRIAESESDLRKITDKAASQLHASESHLHKTPLSRSDPNVSVIKDHAEEEDNRQRRPQKIQPIIVNGKSYIMLNMIGKGGFSKVYQVYDPFTQQTLALKVVDLSKADYQTTVGLKNEIQLLEKLRHCKRVVRLIDYELINSKNRLILVMEKGDSDLGTVLKQFIETDKQLDMTLIKHYWKEMLKAVNEIHKLDVVHSDLKPNNFISVGGKLKLIDFGIANAIQPDDTSVVQNHQVGTLNYMPPEAFRTRPELDPSNGKSGKSYFKFNCKADVWALGCILYALVYGRPPFGHINALMDKMQAVCDPKYPIAYPSNENPQIIDCIKRCLQRNPEKRSSVEELLNHPFLNESIDPKKQQLLSKVADLTPNRLRRLTEMIEKISR